MTFTYASLGAPANAPLTNLRVWKVYGGGNVFHENLDMQQLDARRSSSVIRANGRERRPMRKGDLLEFEFGIFLDSTQVQGRTNYYTDTFRYRVGEGGLTAANADPALGELGPPPRGCPAAAPPSPTWRSSRRWPSPRWCCRSSPPPPRASWPGRRLFHTSFLAGAHSEPENPIFAEQAQQAGPALQRGELHRAATCATAGACRPSRAAR